MEEQEFYAEQCYNYLDCIESIARGFDFNHQDLAISSTNSGLNSAEPANLEAASNYDTVGNIQQSFLNYL
jgi:hypothetical protein